MAKWKVTMKETIVRVVEAESGDAQEAEDELRHAYRSSKIVKDKEPRERPVERRSCGPCSTSITPEKAKQIAEQHLRKANPAMWDGTGERPPGFDTRIRTYPIDGRTELDVSFELEPDGWNHYCELRETDTGELLGALHGYGVDSVLNLTDTIVDVYAGGRIK